jgi:ferrochelatase
MTAGARRLGVLLMTYGSPDNLDDMPRYLTAVRGGTRPPPELIAEFRRRYHAIGGSPLIPITQAAGMRFSEPSVSSALVALASTGCDVVSGIIMSPQFSGRLMSGYERALGEAALALGTDAPPIHLAPAWYRNARFVEAVSRRIRESLERLPRAEQSRAPVLLTAHSLPRRVAEMEPAYLDQLRETAEIIANRAGLRRKRWHFCWQSAGHEPGEWMKPDFADLLPDLRDAGHRSVLVAPIQFLADHLEVLYDIDIGARAQADRAGMAFARIESLNLMPEFVAALADVALGALPA